MSVNDNAVPAGFVEVCRPVVGHPAAKVASMDFRSVPLPPGMCTTSNSRAEAYFDTTPLVRFGSA